VSPTASGSKLRNEKPAGVNVQVLVRYSSAYGKKKSRKKIEVRVINKEEKETKE
jgi:hypothetical protein